MLIQITDLALILILYNFYFQTSERLIWYIYKRWDQISSYKQTNKIMKVFAKRYALTFGEAAIIRDGCGMLGTQGNTGFSVEELKNIQQKIHKKTSTETEFFDLSAILPKEEQEKNKAGVLLMKGMINTILGKNGADQLYAEQETVEYDKKYFDPKKNKVIDMVARYNTVFGNSAQKNTHDFKSFTVHPFSKYSQIFKLRENYTDWFGPKARGLFCEGNSYYEQKSGIHFHGDTGRKIVIGACLGRSDFLRYMWRQPGCSQNSVGPVSIPLGHGDIYIMSEKATGYDVNNKNLYRVVHGAGSDKYVNTRNKEYKAQDPYLWAA